MPGNCFLYKSQLSKFAILNQIKEYSCKSGKSVKEFMRHDRTLKQTNYYSTNYRMHFFPFKNYVYVDVHSFRTKKFRKIQIQFWFILSGLIYIFLHALESGAVVKI